MTRLFKHLACLAFILIAAAMPMQKALAQPGAPVSFQAFYDELAPYGQWVNDYEFGNVWVPNVPPGFRPYASDGYWAMTEYGNMWMSDAPYAWAVYHYGRWTYNGYYGWLWIPGYEWAPAWVVWRQGGGYYGWAPMGPGYYRGANYNYPDNWWVFIGPEHLYHRDFFNYYEPNRNVVYIQQTTYINEGYGGSRGGGEVNYSFGPRQEAIERETHERVPVYQVASAGQPGAPSVNGQTVQIYRPAVDQRSMNTARPANVIQADRPIGKPQNITVSEKPMAPEFHTKMQQNPAQQGRGWGATTQPGHGGTPTNGNGQRGSVQPDMQNNAHEQPNQAAHTGGEPANQQSHMQPGNQQQHAQPEPNNQEQHAQPNNQQQQHTQPEPNQQEQHTQPSNQQRTEPNNQQQQHAQPQNGGQQQRGGSGAQSHPQPGKPAKQSEKRK